MRILLLTHYFEPENGAPQRRWSALIQRFRSAGHEVVVLAPPPHYPGGRLLRNNRSMRTGAVHTSDSGAVVLRTAFLRHSGGLITRSMDHAVAAADMYRRALGWSLRGAAAPDVVIATAPALETLIAGRFVAGRFKVPLVAEMRDAWPDLVVHTPGLVSASQPSAIAKRWVHEFVTRLQRRADAVVTTTASFAEVLADRGIKDLAVIRNGTDMERYRLISATPDLVTRPLRVLYMGTIGRSQGLDLLIGAAARLRDQGSAVDVRIVGQGADVPRLRRLNQRLGSPATIHGQIDGGEVIAHYAWADSTVVSLRAWEPFAWTVPSKLYELLAAGKHITALVAGEAAQIVTDTGAGDVVPPGQLDELVSLWSALAADRKLLRIGEGGRQWVRHNADFDQLAIEYLATLARVTQRPPDRAPSTGVPADEL